MCKETTPPVDALQAICANNNMDTSVFVDGDRATARTYWNNVFVHEYQNAVTESLYNAIASKSGAAESAEHRNVSNCNCHIR